MNYRSGFRQLVYVGRGLASNPWKHVSQQVSIDPLDDACIDISHL